MKCRECGTSLRTSNTIGYCRKHRTLSPVVKKRQARLARAAHRRNPDRLRNAALLSNYGITLEQKAEMFARQGGKCVICDKELQLIKAHTDHNHVTGKVRGLLCAACNVAIGLLHDDRERVLRVFEYLSEEP